METLPRRREFGFFDECVSAAHVEPEVRARAIAVVCGADAQAVRVQAVTGEEVAYGYNIQGRPALYLYPRTGQRRCVCRVYA